MDLLLDCPWCADGTLSEVIDVPDELGCGACSTRVMLAPDPVSAAPAREAA